MGVTSAISSMISADGRSPTRPRRVVLPLRTGFPNQGRGFAGRIEHLTHALHAALGVGEMCRLSRHKPLPGVPHRRSRLSRSGRFLNHQEFRRTQAFHYMVGIGVAHGRILAHEIQARTLPSCAAWSISYGQAGFRRGLLDAVELFIFSRTASSFTRW